MPKRRLGTINFAKQTKKQRIVVTLRFLGVDTNNNNTPFVNHDLFQHIEKDKAFFIKRAPYTPDKPETINTEIEVLN